MISVEMEKKISAWIEVTRLWNSLFAGIATVIGALLGGFELFPAFIAFLATYLGTSAGNAVNDVYDVDIDEINNPDRPIPSGRLTEKEVWIGGGVMFIVAVAITVAFLPPLAIGIGLLNLAVMIGYSSHLKRMPFIGNHVVGYLTGSAFLFGGAAVSGVRYTVLLFILAWLVTVGREIVKDIEDIEGDQEMGAETLPIRLGEKKAILIAYISIVIGVGLSPLPLLQREVFGYSYLIGAIPADIMFIYAIYIGLDNPGKTQRYLKAGMYIALAAFLLGKYLGF